MGAMRTNGSARRVMVVDDDMQMRERFYDVLRSKGYQVSTVGSGAQALELLKAQRPQLIILNVALPGLSGLEVARRIRSFDEGLPIVFWKDASAAAPSAQQLQELGVQDVLEKTWESGQILTRLEQALSRSPAAAASGKSGLAGTLLIVDDDPQVQLLLQLFFESKGLRVITVGSGEEALDAIQRKPVLVMLDINMPGLDGVVTLKKIRAAQPSVPVVMMSGGGEEGMARDAIKAGAYDYISKPFDLEYLETVVLTKVLLGIEKD